MTQHTSSSRPGADSWTSLPLGRHPIHQVNSGPAGRSHAPSATAALEPGSAPRRHFAKAARGTTTEHAPPASSVFALHYKPSISPRQLTFRIHKRDTLAGLVELLSIRAYWKSLDGIAVAAVLSVLLRHVRHDPGFSPQVAGQLLQRLEGPLASTLAWNTIQTSTTILWALTRLQDGDGLHPLPAPLLARVLARATASRPKLELVAPRRLSLIAFTAGKLVPRSHLPPALTRLGPADLLPPPPESSSAPRSASSAAAAAAPEPPAVAASISESPPAAATGEAPAASSSDASAAAATPTAGSSPRRPPPDLGRSARIALARVAAAAVLRLPSAKLPAHVAAWEACHFSPQGLANLSLGFARANYLDPALVRSVARSVVALADSPAAPQLDLQDCAGLALAFAHFWPLQPHPEVLAALARAFPAAVALRQRREDGARAAAAGTASGRDRTVHPLVPPRVAAELRAAFASVAAAVVASAAPPPASGGGGLSLQDCGGVATAFARFWPVQRHPQVFAAIAQVVAAAVPAPASGAADAGEERQRTRQQRQLARAAPELRAAFASVGIPLDLTLAV